MDTKNVNLRDVQQLHDGIVLAMDALRRITPQVMLGDAARFGYGSDPFGVTGAPFDHTAALRGVGGLGAVGGIGGVGGLGGIGGLGGGAGLINPLAWGQSGWNHSGWGQGTGYGYGYGVPGFGYGALSAPPYGYGIGYGALSAQPYAAYGMQPYGYDGWTRGMAHSGLSNMLGSVPGGLGAPIAYVPVRAF
jgi:hypothetical protein